MEFVDQQLPIIQHQDIKVYRDKFPDLIKDLPAFEDHCVTYLIYGDKFMYVGETTHLKKRLKDHSKGKAEAKLTDCVIIFSPFFNRSAIYDVETNLISFLFADQSKQLLNKKTNQNSHNYFMKEQINESVFRYVWEELGRIKLVSKSLLEIENSEIFKYSPFKEFSNEQLGIIEKAINSFTHPTGETLISFDGSVEEKRQLSETSQRILIEGGPGTGKTLLIIKIVYDLLKRYRVDNISIAVCVPQTSLQPLVKRLLRTSKLSSAKVVRPIDLSKNPELKYDLLIVDEAHRLKQFFSKQSKDLKHLKNGDVTEFQLALSKAKNTIFMYDSNQAIRPADVKLSDTDFEQFTRFKLEQQFRVKKGFRYLKFLENLLQIDTSCRTDPKDLGDYVFEMVDSIESLHRKILEHEKERGLSRLSSGYSRPWISQKDSSKYDFDDGGYKLQWNTTIKGWAQSHNAVNEVGCIHTLQGQDLNYSGVIIGKDLIFDSGDNQIKANKANYFDQNGTPVKGTDNNDNKLLSMIKNIYYVLLSRGMLGTYIFVEDEGLRTYFASILDQRERR